MKLRLSLTLAALAFAAVPVPSRAAAPAAKPAVVTGEVIDSACYIKSGAKGADHIKCAQACADAGIPLAILEDGTQKVVWVASKKDMDTPNAQLKPFAGKRVKATGTWAERGGARLLVIDSVTPAA
jgi:hypothetical protein